MSAALNSTAYLARDGAVERVRQPAPTDGRGVTFEDWNIASPDIQLRLEVAAEVVLDAFQYLEFDELIAPPSGAFDGSIFARQVFFDILVETFGLPKNRLSAVLGIDRNTIRKSGNSIRERRDYSLRFADWLDGLNSKASLLFLERELHG